MAESGRDGFVTSESTFIVLAILAIILLAAVFPAFNAFGMFDVPSLGEGMGSGSGSGGGGERPGGGNGTGGAGVPGQSDLSPPPENSKIGEATNKSPEPQPLFIAKGAGNQYWRQTAYMTYTGTAWEQSTESQPLREGVPNDGLTRDGSEVEYEIELLTDTTSLPTVWQPESVEIVNQSGSVGLKASTVGGIRSSQTLTDGTSYAAVSQQPPDDPAILRESDQQYPTVIETRYTQLPASTPDRVEQFGDELTADANSPYEASVAIRDWLRSNKEYSLNTSINTSKPVADQFLFEVDRGYCQHFATTMAVLLRTQDIPARYVVGFAGGESIGDGEYLVTSEVAHAWVEVYFEDVGWVTFDPTAASDRDISETPPQPPYNISLNRSAVAGAPVSIQVQKNGSAVVGAPVYVEGERIDWTDSSGEAATRLPWVQNITIVVRPPGSESQRTGQSDDGQVASVEPSGNLPPPTAHPQLRYAVRETPIQSISSDSQGSSARDSGATGVLRTTGSGQGQPIYQTETTVNESAENYTAETNVTIELPESVIQGETVQLKASIKDVPLRNATIAINGEPVGEADRQGQFELGFNNTALGENTVSASRGEVKGSTSIFVKPPPEPDEENETNESRENESTPRTINVSVSPALDFPIPFGPATVNVTDGSGPVEGALISVAETDVGHTSANGTLQIRFPISKSVTVSAMGPESATAEQTIDNLYRNAALLLGGIGIVVLGILVLIWWLDEPLQRARARFQILVGLILDGFLRLTQAIASAGYWMQSYLLYLWEEIQDISLGELIAKIQVISVTDLEGIKARLVALMNGFLRSLRELFEEQADAIKDGQATTEDGDGSEFGLADLWQEFISIVQPPNVSTRTPGEIGRYAVSRGFPKKPVSLFVQWYRDAIYGPESKATSRIDRAKNYLSDIREGDDRS